MNVIKKIAVIGATGMLGVPVASALLDADFEVTALARNPSQAKRVLPAATRIVAADVRDEDSLRHGLVGQDALYLNLSVAPDERRTAFHTEQQGLDHILSAVRAVDIKRVGYLSAMVHDSPSRWWVLELWRSAILRIKDFARASTARTTRLTLPLFFIHLAGIASPAMRFNGRMMRTVLRYPETFKAEDTWRDLGRPTTTIEEFAVTKT